MPGSDVNESHLVPATRRPNGLSQIPRRTSWPRTSSYVKINRVFAVPPPEKHLRNASQI